MSSEITIPNEVKEAMLLLDFGQKFALCHTNNIDTRNDVKKLREHIDIINKWMVSLNKE